MKHTILTLLLCALAVLIPAAGAAAKGDTVNRAEWMAGHYGIMTHWFVYPDLALPEGTQEERTAWFNEQVDAFDVKTLMKQFDETGAEWLIFTLAQSNGYFNSANPFLDRVYPGHTPKRDLGLEIAREVKKRGKRFIIYLPGQFNNTDQYAKGLEEAFCWKKGEDNSVNPEFEDCMAALFEGYARKYGRLCDGWWIDGCYHELHREKWDWERWCRAMRSGNPDSAVALSDGSFCIGILKPLYDGCDYFGGETHDIEKGMIRIDATIGPKEDYGEGKKFYLNDEGYVRVKGERPRFFVPATQYICGQQLQSLMCLDQPWSEMPVEWNSYSAEELAMLARNMKRARGGLTINIPNTGNGSLQQSTVDKVAEMGRLIK
ncbi:MAG: alpha-L-fucosidase [Abditibacteriota bacterium]|nr:alpha-L-fucosidase [Abditibacteriota bacterium]